MTEGKHCFVLATASSVILMHRKQIQSFVGPSDVYMLMKDMKLENSEVSTIKFRGEVPRIDIREYVEKRPNISTVITDSYGPSSWEWKAFDSVRNNLTSFYVRSKYNGLVDVYVRLSVYDSPQRYDYIDQPAVLSVEDTMKVVLKAARLSDKATVYLYCKHGNSTLLCKDKLAESFRILPTHHDCNTVNVCVHKLCLINSTVHVAEDRYFRIQLKRVLVMGVLINEQSRRVSSGYRITKITDVCSSTPCEHCF